MENKPVILTLFEVGRTIYIDAKRMIITEVKVTDDNALVVYLIDDQHQEHSIRIE